MDENCSPLLEFCEETQDYHLVKSSYPKCIKMFRNGEVQNYKEIIKFEPLVTSDGTMFVQALKMYEKITEDSIEKIKNSSQSENKVCRRNIAGKIKRVAKCSKSNASIKRQNMAKKQSANSKICRYKCMLKVNHNHVLNLASKFRKFSVKSKETFLSRLIRKRLQILDDGKHEIIDYFWIPDNSRLLKICRSCFKKIFSSDFHRYL